MYVSSNAAVTFIGNSNIMQSNTAPSNQGKSIYSSSSNLTFSVCKPGTTTSGTFSGHLEIDFDGCLKEVCTWHLATTGTHDVPAAGCKMSKRIDVLGEMTIQGVDGSLHELQANPS